MRSFALPAQLCIVFAECHAFILACIADAFVLQERVQEANAGSPSQAKFRKAAQEQTNSPTKAKVETLKSDTSAGSPKRAGSGFSDKVPRMTCFGTSDGPIPEKKPSLAQRYSAWKVSHHYQSMSGSYSSHV